MRLFTFDAFFQSCSGVFLMLHHIFWAVIFCFVLFLLVTWESRAAFCYVSLSALHRAAVPCKLHLIDKEQRIDALCLLCTELFVLRWILPRSARPGGFVSSLKKPDKKGGWWGGREDTHTSKTVQVRFEVNTFHNIKKPLNRHSLSVPKNLTNGKSGLGNKCDTCGALSVEGLSTVKGHSNTAYMAKKKPTGTEEMCSSTHTTWYIHCLMYPAHGVAAHVLCSGQV